MQHFEIFIEKLKKIHPTLLVSCCLILIIINSFFFSISFPNVKGTSFLSFKEALFATVIMAPLIETYIFQYLVIKYSLNWFNNNKFIALLLSALLFGLVHWYAIPYMVKTFISGLLYGILYLILMDKISRSIIAVIIVHALHNLFATVMNAFF